MKPRDPASSRLLQDRAFMLLVVAVSLAFGWILWPFFGAVFWATILAILFAPLCRRLTGWMRQRRNLAALGTLLIILVIVILPSVLITALLVQEGLGVYGRIQSGELSPGRYLQHLNDALPAWVSSLLDRFELTNLRALQARLSAALVSGFQLIASHAVNVGQNAFNFVLSFFIMLYLLFFLLRDGRDVARRVRAALPLDEDLQRNLFSKFAGVIRATVKGSIVVALLQGTLGGLIFWFLGVHAPVLWGVVMAFLSLLPAVGTGLVWVPVAIYLLMAGALWKGLILIVYGVLVIGLVDNLVRPILVGKGTKMPDYVVLISTLGGMAVFGLNGFVIGPAIAALFIAVWDVLATEKAANPVR